MATPDRGSWGILGGTFDPVHLGHLTLAAEIRRKKTLDGVLLTPSFSHPFKNDVFASYADRVEMARLAAAEHDFLSVSEIESEESLDGYTLSTVRALKERYPETTFDFLVGEDILYELDRWHKPEEILEEVTLLVGCRPPHNDRWGEKTLPKQIVMVDTQTIEVSSTELRKALREGDDVTARTMAPQSVLSYIRRKGLYK